MPEPVRGRTALVTGAGNGLGREIALALGRAGARVLLAGRRPDALHRTVKLAHAESIDTRVQLVDVSDPSSVHEATQQLADETISVLVNNAGVPGPVAPLTEIDPGDWDELFAVNVRGVFLMCRAFVPPMVQRGNGDVINLASVSGKRPLIGRAGYCASKTAVIGLSTTLGAEVGPAGVRVNTLSPGPVQGARMARNFELEAKRTGVDVAEAERQFTSKAAMGRLVQEREVGDAVVAMLSMTALHCADIDLSAGMVGR